MPKIPRDLSGRELARLLSKFNYKITRQTGSHLRLTTNFSGSIHHITIPDHVPIKIGTLNKIIKEVADYLRIDRESLIKELFKDEGKI